VKIMDDIHDDNGNGNDNDNDNSFISRKVIETKVARSFDGSVANGMVVVSL